MKFEKGKFYIVDGETVEYLETINGKMHFQGASDAVKLYTRRFAWMAQVLDETIEATHKDVDTLLARRAAFNEGKAAFVACFGAE